MSNKNNKVDRVKWTKEKILTDILTMYENGEKLNAVSVTKNNIKLYGAARTHFGSWANAVSSAGLNYDEINHRVSEMNWSKETIIQEIVRFATEDGNLRSDYVQKHYTKLHSAAQRYFASWREAVECAGFDYDNIKQVKWTKENIIMSILEIKENNQPLCSSEIQKSNMPLFQAACRIFGSWSRAIESAGINYRDVKKQKEWEDDSIKTALLRLKEEKGNLSVTTVIKDHASLYQAAKRHFPHKTWKEIIDIISEEN